MEGVGSVGHAIMADATDPEVVADVQRMVGAAALIIADPPYGNVVTDSWDRWDGDQDTFAEWMLGWTRLWSSVLLPGGAFYVWGGIGTTHFRPFFRYLTLVERPEAATGLVLGNLITWKKRRAYGVQWNYLFTREECAYLVKGDDPKKPRCFNVPLLEEKRGYAGYDAKHPAKSEFFRRTNVWTDVTEVMRGKVHVAQKAQRVIEVPIEVHTQPGELIIDPFAGSGTTGLAAMRLGRRFLVIERDPETFETMLARLRDANEGVSGVGCVSHGKTKVTERTNDHEAGQQRR